MSVIRLENVTKKYEETLIFRDIYFRVSQGERIALIGRNGAGKSTVFKLILGHEEPTSGKVELDPKVKLGYFSQFSELRGSLSVQQELEMCFEQVALIERELQEVGEKMGTVTDDGEMDRLLIETSGAVRANGASGRLERICGDQYCSDEARLQ